MIKKLVKRMFGGQRHVVEMTGKLYARVWHDGKWRTLGLIAVKKVTTAFANYLVASLQNQTTSPIDVFKYHDSGTGSTAESNAQTGLITPCGEARDVGTQAQGGSANIYRSIATHTYSGGFAIVEHGLFSASSAGTLMDRSLFSAINVVATDKIEWTYELTVNAEA
jgi:hypothetical protein